MHQDQDIYRQFCAEETGVPIFMQPWWLDVVTQASGWGVSIAQDAQSKIKAALTYGIFSKYGVKYLSNPVLTPYCGPWLTPIRTDQYYEINSFENQQISDLIANLPSAALVILKLFPTAINAFPWVWSGYKTGLKHTYHLDLAPNYEQQYKDTVHQDILRASARLSVQTSQSPEDLFRLTEQLFLHQKKKTPFTESLLHQLCEQIHNHHAGVLAYVRDEKNRLVAGALLVWDHSTAYYLIGARDPQNDPGGAMSYLLHQLIKHLPAHLKIFDFEGSMIKGVEHFFRSFGGQRANVLEVTKPSSLLAKIYMVLKA